MQSTFDIVAGIIARTCDVPPVRITADSNLLSDLGIDSLDLLDAAFAIDDTFGITIPLDQWLRASHLQRPPSDHHFVMRQFCANIDKLIVMAAA
jgi:acyl carrier protein